ncbi:uncharacterized protein [Arachis hypogaea]|uniref:uncharacterized protein n=1 Tax=Arachis hypogaea TaxID=3818 RepID=UPI000DECA6A7|nr:uncharacterized protein LOC112757075 [Arachis hypogaea]
MDRTWIEKPRTTKEYMDGIIGFLDFAFARATISDRICCPCPRCVFGKWHKRDTVQDHLLLKPFPRNYVIWNRHGEIQPVEPSSIEVQAPPSQENPLNTLLHDVFGHHGDEGIMGLNDAVIPDGDEDIADGRLHEGSFDDGSEFNEFLKDGNEKLHEGSKCTKLEFIIKLYHIKVLCRISDKAMTMILTLLRDTFDGIQLPSSFYKAKQITYKIHASIAVYLDGSLRKKKKKQAAKVLRYFPLKPRLKRLYMCSKTAEHMQWHNSAPARDGLLRHPRDGEAWKNFNAMHTLFAEEPRNVRLGLATDGFNPFGALSSTNSVWPVFLIPYNLPPWMCMNHTSFILSMVIPGKKSPGNKIDVYLQPLINELKDLWIDGVETFDSSSGNTFRMHAALMWTISDFPGLGMLSGWNTHTGLACPTCNFDSFPCYLRHSSKWCFMGHRRFLGRNHRFRLNRVRFDGSTEERGPPKKLLGSDILEQQQDVETRDQQREESRSGGKRPRREVKQWNKRSIFFDLPYWKTNLLRHNLDFMHIEKNVCDNILYTLLNDKAKSKDNLKAQKDLKEMGIRRDLWPSDNGSYHLSLFSLTRDTKKLFLSALKNVVLPDGYSSNISRYVDEGQKKIFGLKSHDCHILLEELLPIAVRHLLPDHVTAVLAEFGSFFKILCGKSLSNSELDKLQQRIVVVLCQLEMLFPPSFFTVMVHLTVHLVDEAKLGGPVHYQYMYPIERELGHLKSHVRNRAQAEASIAEGYLAEECLTFCSRYFEDIETRFNRARRIMNPDTIEQLSTDIKFLARGPLSNATRYSAYKINGCTFRTVAREEGLRTQNSGVYLTSSTPCVASRVDKNLRQGDVPYYGKLEDIIEVSYYGRFTVVLFKCKWADSTRHRGYRRDQWHFHCVNFERPIHTGEHEEDEPYILASQASMVYYVDDVVNKG